MLNEWLPIETAPQKYQECLGWDGQKRLVMRGGSGRWHSIPGEYTFHPTHWMPLPEPPKC